MRMVILIATNHKHNREMIIDGVISIKVITTWSGYFLYIVKSSTKDGYLHINNISTYEWPEIRILHQ